MIDRPGLQSRRHAAADQQERRDISVEPRTKVWVEHNGRFVMGDGGLRLLRCIQAYGSLTVTARDVGWSYRHAWEYIRRAERVLGLALTSAVPGKGKSRGTALTPYGVSLLERLEALRQRVDAALGPTGPTPEEVASRGTQAHKARGGRTDASARPARPSPAR
jgi:molybdate transport system regulatory protein